VEKAAPLLIVCIILGVQCVSLHRAPQSFANIFLLFRRFTALYNVICAAFSHCGADRFSAAS